MKAALPMLTAFATAASLASATVELPSWKDHSERSKQIEQGWIAGAALLSHEPDTTPGDAPTEESLTLPQANADELASPAMSGIPLPEAFWWDYFGEKPKSFLVDPQGLLNKANHKELLSFLNYHAEDSSIDLFTYLFKEDQEIPGECRQEELIERCFSSGRPAAVVFYFLSSPHRAKLYLSPDLLEKISTAEQRRSLEGSIMQAAEKNDAQSQLSAFLIQMSIRLYWMERRIGGSHNSDTATAATAHPKAKKEKKPSKVELLLNPWVEQAKPLARPAAITAGSLVTFILLTIWLRRRKRYRFPEIDVEPRLGGNHAAGIGAVISFASASLPPASQKDQLPEYLRRM